MTLAVDAVHSIDSIDREWDELCDAADASPFLRPGWFKCWLDAFGSGTPRLLTARRSGALVGVVPVLRRGGVLRSASNWHSPEFGIVATGDDVASALVAGLLEEGTRRCSLAFVPSDDQVARSWAELCAAGGRRGLSRVVERSPYIDTNGDWSTYEAGLPKKLRSELKRRRRRLEEKGAVRVDVADGTRDLDDLLVEGFRIEEAAWKGSSGTAINSDEKTRRFYTEVARWAAERGWLRLCFLSRGDTRLTFDLSIETGGVHYLLKTGYEPAYSKFAPGMLMRYEMIKRAFEHGFSSYEFLGSDNPWKLQWTGALRDRMMLQAFGSSPAGWIDWFAFEHARPLVKRTLARVRGKQS